MHSQLFKKMLHNNFMKKALLFIVLFLAQINTFAEDIQVAMLEPLATTDKND